MYDAIFFDSLCNALNHISSMIIKEIYNAVTCSLFYQHTHSPNLRFIYCYSYYLEIHAVKYALCILLSLAIGAIKLFYSYNCRQHFLFLDLFPYNK